MDSVLSLAGETDVCLIRRAARPNPGITLEHGFRV